MLECELYLVIANSTGLLIRWIDMVFSCFLYSSEFVIVAKYSLKMSATHLSLKIIAVFSGRVTVAEDLIVPENKGFTVFQNFRLSYSLSLAQNFQA